MLHSAPAVLNRLQNSEYRIVGRFADAATANASATRNATFCPFATMPPRIATTPIDHGGHPGDPHLGARGRPSRADHVGVHVVGERRRRGDRQPGDHGEDRREGDRRDEPEQQLAAELVGQQRAAALSWSAALSDPSGRPVPRRRSRAPA